MDFSIFLSTDVYRIIKDPTPWVSSLFSSVLLALCQDPLWLVGYLTIFAFSGEKAAENEVDVKYTISRSCR